MKILFVNTFDSSGGAANNVHLLCKSLQSVGVQCEMLVQFKGSDDPTVIGPSTKLREKMNWLHSLMEGLPLKFYPNKNKTMFSTAWMPNGNIVTAINKSNADIVHLHWIACGMIRVEDIARIKKPIIWSLHDMWPFTGGCHYDGGCGKYATHCTACPVLGSCRKIDLSYIVHARKIKAYAKIQSLTVNGISRWIADCAKESKAFSGKNIVNISSPIDTHAFRPLDKAIARDLLNLPQDKKLILFGGDGMVQDPRKGYRYLKSALELIRTPDVELLIFGSGNFTSSIQYKFPVHYLGHLPNDLALRIAYSAADVYVMPSVQEVLGWVSTESMACGTPAVAFDIGGPKDIIDHMINGYLATPCSSSSLAEGIDWVLNYPDPASLSQTARQNVQNKFEATIIAKRYRDLYNSII
ncbi:MAG: glycosyltransferase family 4 protein [Methanoregula sp.]|nr:glycosyltransferase family 4 protein [Methanoregula sp.]